MLAIPESLLNATVYLYPSAQAAKEGVAAGGSGFVVGVPSSLADAVHLYVVTNRHVVDGGSRVVRFNTSDGKADAITSEPGDWTIASDDDLAVLPFVAAPHFRWSCIATELFLTEDCAIDELIIEAGDNTVLMGRLVTHDGKQRNKPVARFGNVAMLADPTDPVRIGDVEQLAFLVECRSLSGFSGSPVLVYLADTRFGKGPSEPLPRISNKPKLLGIDCAHLPAWAPVCTSKNPGMRIPEMWVETNSGMAVVIPAWRLLRLLNEEHLVTERSRSDAELSETRRQGASAIPDAIE